MRSSNLGAIVLVMFVMAFLANSVWALKIISPFPDPNFEAVIREELNKPGTFPIFDTDMLDLVYLDASNRGISDVTGIGYAINLGVLFLDHNQISDLPDDFENLTMLTSLILDHNQFSTFPPEIGTITNLWWLDLQCNQLTSLPPEIGNLINLNGLVLWSNQLTSLPPEIGNLLYLGKLDVHSNQLITLPAEMENLTELNELRLDDNPLDTMTCCQRIPAILENNQFLYYINVDCYNSITYDCYTDPYDMTLFFSHWGDTGCDASNWWCIDADLNHDGVVDLLDVAVYASLWLAPG